MAAKKLSITQESIKDFISNEKRRLGEGYDDDKVFEYISAQQILKDFSMDDDETERGLTGGGNDGGFDGVYIFINEALVTGEDPESLEIPNQSKVEIHLIQAKNTAGFSASIVHNWRESFFNLLSGEEDDPERYSSAVIEDFVLIRSILSKMIFSHLRVKVMFWAVSIAEQIHPNVQKSANEFIDEVKEKIPESIQLGIRFIMADDLFSMMTRLPQEVMLLQGDKEPMCLDDSSAVIAVTLPEFNKFISNSNGNINKQLFESNIRDYQGRTEVNKSIRATLEGAGDIDFWWLNNGITIVADAVSRGMSGSIALTNPRIVNGLQTSNEIKHYCDSHNVENEKRKVLVKCIASQDQEIRAQIIAATNKQTTIPPAYLRSLELIHLKIERYYASHGLHYDRRKSSCRNEGIKPKDIISVPFLGQCLIATLLQQPDYARARPAQILNDDKKYAQIFNDSISLETYLSLGSLALAVRQWFKQSKYTRGEQNDLLFYVLLVICALQAGKFNLSADDIANVSIPPDKMIETIAEGVYHTYQRLGANSTVAKSHGFVEEVSKQFLLY